MSDNTITIAGNLTRDPELRFTSGGRAVANLGVAVANRYQENGEWVDGTPNFFNVVAWGMLGENTAKSLTKGARVVVKGRMTARPYETQSGDKKVAWELIADDVSVSLKFSTVEGVVKTVGPNAGLSSTRPEAAEEAVEEPAAA